MPGTPEEVLASNKQWAAEVVEKDPNYFSRLAIQRPDYLWIGCADSRVPATTITGLEPGQVFVHRNVANQVIYSDMNCLSVVQFGVEVLKVKHIIVCGHYGCSGVGASLTGPVKSIVDNWILHICEIREKHQALLDCCADDASRHRRMCELNLVEQVHKLARTYVVRNAWDRGEALDIRGWIYDISNGVLEDLGTTICGPDETESVYQETLARLSQRD